MKFLWIRLWLFLLSISYAIPVHGQTALQPVYTRPAKGQPITLFSAQNIGGSFSTTASSVYDWRGFSRANVAIEIRNSSGASVNAGNCTYYPNLTAYGTYYASINTSIPAGKNFVIDDPNSVWVPDLGGSTVYGGNYSIDISSPYAYFQLSSSIGVGATTCFVTVTVTPLPFSGANRSERIVSYDLVSITTNTKVSEGYGASRQFVIQNQGIVILYCGNYGVTSSSFSFSLSAGTAAKDGTGGSASLSDFGGSMYCTAASGTGSVSYMRW